MPNDNNILTIFYNAGLADSQLGEELKVFVSSDEECHDAYHDGFYEGLLDSDEV